MAHQSYSRATAGTCGPSKENKRAVTRLTWTRPRETKQRMISMGATTSAIRRTICTISLGALLCAPWKIVCAQAAPGPMGPAQPADSPGRDRPVSLPAARPARKPIGGHPNLSGVWNLNKDDSDDAAQSVRQAEGNSGNSGGPQHHGGWGGPMGGPGGNGPYGGGGSGGGNGGGMHGRNQGGRGEDPAADLQSISIDQTATTTVVTSSSGKTLTNYTAPASNSSNDASAGSTSSPKSSSSSSSSSTKSGGDSAQWQDDRFITMTQDAASKTKTTRTYELSSDGSQLNVATKLEGPRYKQPVSFLLVYDPAPDEKSGNQ
jgi:hypothetical protein